MIRDIGLPADWLSGVNGLQGHFSISNEYARADARQFTDTVEISQKDAFSRVESSLGIFGTDNVSHWSMMRERSVIAVGWTKMRDLSWGEANQGKRAKLKQLLQQAYPNNVATAVGRDAQELIHFIAGIAEGDVVLASDGAKVLGIGVVSGAYEYCPDFAFPHQRSVTWLDTHEWKMPIAEGLRSAVRPLNKKDENILEAESRIQGTRSITDPIIEPPIDPRPQLSKFLTRVQSILDPGTSASNSNSRRGSSVYFTPVGNRFSLPNICLPRRRQYRAFSLAVLALTRNSPNSRL